MERLFLGINGYVVCINKQDGKELWRTKLKSSSITNVYYENSLIYAHAGGHLYCVHAKSGEIQWENELKGLGYGTCIIAGADSSSVVQAQASQQAASAAAAGTTAATSGNSN